MKDNKIIGTIIDLNKKRLQIEASLIHFKLMSYK